MHTQQSSIVKMIFIEIGRIVRPLLSDPYAWLFFGLIVLILALKQLGRWLEHRRLAAAKMDEVDHMTGKDFEKFLEVAFRRLGYSCVIISVAESWI